MRARTCTDRNPLPAYSLAGRDSAIQPRHEQHAHIGMVFPDLLGQSSSAHCRQDDIGQQQMHAFGRTLEGVERLRPVRGLKHCVAGSRQHLRRETTDVGIVLDEQIVSVPRSTRALGTSVGSAAAFESGKYTFIVVPETELAVRRQMFPPLCLTMP